MENFWAKTALKSGFFEHFSTFSTFAMLKTWVFVMIFYENHKVFNVFHRVLHQMA